MPGSKRVAHTERRESTNIVAPDRKKLLREKTMTIRKETIIMLLLTAVAACAVHTGGTQLEAQEPEKPAIKTPNKEFYNSKIPKKKATEENKSFEKAYDWSGKAVETNMKKKLAGNKNNNNPISTTKQEEECDSWFYCDGGQLNQIAKNLIFTGAMLALMPVIAIFAQIADRIKNGPREPAEGDDQDDSPDANEDVQTSCGYAKALKARRKTPRFSPK